MSSTQEVGDIFGNGSGPAHAMLRSPTVLIAAIGLWGMNLYFFRLFGIDYVKVLKYDLYKLAKEELERHQNYYGTTNSGSSTSTSSTSNLQSKLLSDDPSTSNPQDDSDDENNNSDNVHTNNNNNTNNTIISETRSLLKPNSDVTERIIVDSIPGGTSTGTATKRGITPQNSATTINGIGMTPINIPPALQEFLSEEDDIYVGSNNNNYIIDDVEATIMESGSTGSSSSTIEKGTGPIVLHTNHQAVTWGRLMALSLSLLLVLHGTYFVWIDIYHGGTIGAVFCFYGAVATFILFPLRSTEWLRKSATIVFVRTFELITIRFWCFRITDYSTKLPNGPRAIPFVDVFFADAMCSMSKVLFDWGMLLHMAYYFPDPVPPSSTNILIPSAFASIPYFIRARQCLVMYAITKLKNDPHRFAHLWNALKYSTSLFPLLLSAYQNTVRPSKAESLEKYLILLLIINATYSLFWDIVMDWGMMKNPSAAASVACGGTKLPVRLDQPRSSTCWHVLLRQRLRFGVGMSLVVLITDSILRFSWTLRFYHKLFPSHNSFVLCTQFLEIFRRAIWNLLRIEWEHLKQSGGAGGGSSSSTTTSSSASQIIGGFINRHHHHHHQFHHHNSTISNNGNSNSNNNSNSLIEFASLVPNGGNGNNNIGGSKDEDEKARLLLQRSNVHIVAGNKVKP